MRSLGSVPFALEYGISNDRIVGAPKNRSDYFTLTDPSGTTRRIRSTQGKILQIKSEKGRVSYIDSGKDGSYLKIIDADGKPRLLTPLAIQDLEWLKETQLVSPLSGDSVALGWMGTDLSKGATEDDLIHTTQLVNSQGRTTRWQFTPFFENNRYVHNNPIVAGASGRYLTFTQSRANAHVNVLDPESKDTFEIVIPLERVDGGENWKVDRFSVSAQLTSDLKAVVSLVEYQKPKEGPFRTRVQLIDRDGTTHADRIIPGDGVKVNQLDDLGFAILDGQKVELLDSRFQPQRSYELGMTLSDEIDGNDPGYTREFSIDQIVRLDQDQVAVLSDVRHIPNEGGAISQTHHSISILNRREQKIASRLLDPTTRTTLTVTRLVPLGSDRLGVIHYRDQEKSLLYFSVLDSELDLVARKEFRMAYFAPDYVGAFSNGELVFAEGSRDRSKLNVYRVPERKSSCR